MVDMRDRFPHTFEAKVMHKAPKSWIIEMTLGGKYILPFKCALGGVDGLDEGDGEGNHVFEVNDWWWERRADFEAD